MTKQLRYSDFYGRPESKEQEQAWDAEIARRAKIELSKRTDNDWERRKPKPKPWTPPLVSSGEISATDDENYQNSVERGY